MKQVLKFEMWTSNEVGLPTPLCRESFSWADFLARPLEHRHATCAAMRRTELSLLVYDLSFQASVCLRQFGVHHCRDVNGDDLMDVMVGAYGSSHLSEGAAHVVYGTNTSAAYEASFLDLGGGSGGGLDGIDGFTLAGLSMEFPLYAELVRSQEQ